MTFETLLLAVATYGPTVIPLVEKLVAAVESGRGAQTVTAADLAEISAYAANTAASRYAALGIALPPAAATAAVGDKR